MTKTDKPLVSIIVCCYNREHLLSKTMESVFAQNYSPVEIIVLDDGSTDGTSDLMKGYGNRIRYYRQDNQGIAVTRTNACLLARGEYIAFQDDDDIMPPDRITILYHAIFQYPDAVFAVGDWLMMDEDGNLTENRYLPENSSKATTPVLLKNGYEAVLWPKVPAAPHTTLFRKDCGEKINWFDTQYKYASEDKDFFARLCRLGPIVYVPRIVSYYRRGHSSMTNRKIVTDCHSITFFLNHLNSIHEKDSRLYKRLQFRILSQLKRIALYRSNGFALPDSVPSDFLTNSLASLTLMDRIHYWLYRTLTIRIKKIIKNKRDCFHNDIY
ncbi:MAG: glycosyltransferase [Desulfobacteraceae bacterium]|nr:MAG: glycosyltransferase [Desulfobacteraceae bacterium]